MRYARDAVSKTGNEYIKLCLTVFDGRGGEVDVWDMLIPAIKHKFKHFLRHTGLNKNAKDGELVATDVLKLNGKCTISTKANDGYAPKNVVDDYLEDEVEETFI